MSGFTLGHIKDHTTFWPVQVSLEKLVDTRLLIQGNSGAGKSHLLRRIAEQVAKLVQIIILDPEGEFSTLREKHDFVLVGKEGEVQAEVRSAGLLARKMMELKTSAVIDLYDLRLDARREYIKLFLESLLSLDKKLHHPVLVAIDEAHLFCPEKSAGESQSTEAVIALQSQGRKRGLCGALLTQRLSKLHKDAAAECNNVVIGRTWLDTDQKRAADALGMDVNERRSLRELKAGEFMAFGPAFHKNGVFQFRGGDVETTHPQAGKRYKMHAPAPSEAVKKVLSELKDLPQQAAEEITNLKAAMVRIKILEQRLKEQPKPAPQPAAKTVYEKVIKASEIKRLETYILGLLRSEDKFLAAVKDLDTVRDRLAQAQQVVVTEAGMVATKLERIKTGAQEPVKLPPLLDTYEEKGKPFVPPQKKPQVGKVFYDTDKDPSLTGPERKILTALAQLGPLMVKPLAYRTGYSWKGGAFNNPLGRLRTKGYVKRGQPIAITPDGVEALGEYTPLPTGSKLRQYWEAELPGPEEKLIKALSNGGMTKEVLAEATGYTVGGGAFNNPLGKLRSLGLLVNGEGGMIYLAPELCD